MKKIRLLIAVAVLVQFQIAAQSIGIGTTTPHASALLDITSTTKGMLLPRMTSAERSGIASPAIGLMIFDNTTQSLWTNTTSGWVNMNETGSSGWNLTGNSNSNPGANFIGTTDNQSVMFKVNNQSFGMLCTNKSVLWGYQAGVNNTAPGNIAIGPKALFNNTSRKDLVAIGDSALYNNGVGATLSWHATENVAIGSRALYSNTIGNRNMAIGFHAMYSNTSGSENTAMGFSALESNTEGFNNTAMGMDALYHNTTGYYNSAFGDRALIQNTTGDYNTAMGAAALNGNISGYHNTAFGSYALADNATGFYNTAIGVSALVYNVQGCYGTAVGYRAMQNSNITSAPFINYNVAIGFEALRGSPAGSSIGNYNTAIGYTSLWNNSTGYSNTATGFKALYNNLAGTANTAAGSQALESNTSGSSNTGYGERAVLANATGDYNSAFGKNAYFVNGALNNTTCIGYNAGGNVNASNRVEIGNTSVSWIGGQQTWSTYSDGRIKDNIAADVPGLDFITLLRPVTYNLNIHRQNEMVYGGRKEEEEWPTKYDVEQIRTTGFIAQEVAQAANEAGYDFSGVEIPKDPNELYSLRYSDFVVPLVKAVQEQQEMIESQQAIIQAQQQILEDIQNQLKALRKNE